VPHSDRRNFLRTLVGGLAATAAVRTWPFRVYSFPTEVKVYKTFDMDYYVRNAMESLCREMDSNNLQYGYAIDFKVRGNF
jgi:hypothetical protein